MQLLQLAVVLFATSTTHASFLPTPQPRQFVVGDEIAGVLPV